MSDLATLGRETATDQTVAYFSMEIALEEKIPTYSGGLGLLAGDTLRSAADLAIPLVAVSLVHRRGYFRQRLDPAGNQTEEPASWVVGDLLKEADVRTSVEIEQRNVAAKPIPVMLRRVIICRASSGPSNMTDS